MVLIIVDWFTVVLYASCSVFHFISAWIVRLAILWMDHFSHSFYLEVDHPTTKFPKAFAALSSNNILLVAGESLSAIFMFHHVIFLLAQLTDLSTSVALPPLFLSTPSCCRLPRLTSFLHFFCPQATDYDFVPWNQFCKNSHLTVLSCLDYTHHNIVGGWGKPTRYKNKDFHVCPSEISVTDSKSDTACKLNFSPSVFLVQFPIHELRSKRFHFSKFSELHNFIITNWHHHLHSKS